MANSSQPFISQPPSTGTFSPSTSSLIVNALWLLSLSLGLACALAATLAQHWARNYFRSVERFQQSPYKHGLIRALMFEGLERSHLGEIVEHIPTLIHAALFLFLAGLVTFLHEISLPMAYLVLSILAACSILYGIATLSPLFYPESPLHTPLSSMLWYALRYAFKVDTRPMHTISKVQEHLATQDFEQPRHRDRVIHAIRWTSQLANEPHEFEDFLIAIPGIALWQRHLFTSYLHRNKDYLQSSCSRFLKTLVTSPRFGTVLQPSRHTQSLQGIYCLAAHGLTSSDRLVTRMETIKPLMTCLSSCDSRNLSLVFGIVFALITGRHPTASQLRPPPATSPNQSSLESDPVLLPIDPSGIGRRIDRMLEFKLGLVSPQEASQSSDSVSVFQPFDFIIRKTLHDPMLHKPWAYVDFRIFYSEGLRVLIEAIWQAAEDSQDQESFQQITFVSFLHNILSAYTYLTSHGVHHMDPESIRILLSTSLRATASLDDKPAVIEAISLLSRYSQANPQQYHGVQEAKDSLGVLQEKQASGNVNDISKRHIQSIGKPSRPIDSTRSVHHITRSSQFQDPPRTSRVRDARLYDFHTNWFATYTFPEIEDRR